MSLYNELIQDAMDQARMYESIKRQRNDEAIAQALHEHDTRETSRSPARSRARARSRSRSRDRATGNTERRSASLDRNHGVGRDCSVCLVEMKRADKRCLLACPEEHVFHDKCIKKWLRRSNTCPVCRGEVRGTTIIR